MHGHSAWQLIEAHHSGQARMLARQFGFRLPALGIWNWEKLWKDAGSPGE